MNNESPYIIDGGFSPEVVKGLERSHPEIVFVKYGDFGDYSWLLPFRDNIRKIRFAMPVPDGRFLEKFPVLEEVLSLCEEKPKIDLAALHGLKRLDLVWNKKYRPDSLRNLPLTELQITSWNQSDVGTLSGILALESILLTGGSLRSLDGIEGLPNLQSLDIRSMRKLEDIDACRRAPVLSGVSFCNLPALASIAALGQMQGLRAISLETLSAIKDIDPVFTGLARTGIRLVDVGKNFSVGHLDLSGCPNLEWLKIGNPVEAPDWAKLIAMPKLKQLWLAYKGGPNPYDVVPALISKHGRTIIYQSGSHVPGRRSWHDLKLS